MIKTCNLRNAKLLSKFKIEYNFRWYYIFKIGDLLLKLDNDTFCNPITCTIIDKAQIKKHKWKLIPAWTLSDLTEFLKDAPINWQYFYNRVKKRWQVADFYATKVTESLTLEDSLSEMIIYLLKNKFFDKLISEQHELVPEITLKSLKRSKGVAPDEK